MSNTVTDDEVVEALLKDARRFKSRHELRVGEIPRLRPNTNFLQRTLMSTVKMNNYRDLNNAMQRDQEPDDCQPGTSSSSSSSLHRVADNKTDQGEEPMEVESSTDAVPKKAKKHKHDKTKKHSKNCPKRLKKQARKLERKIAKAARKLAKPKEEDDDSS